MGRLFLFVGSLNREAPYFQGARGVGLCVYAFDEDRRVAARVAETNEPDNPTFLSVTPDARHVYVNSEVFTWREGTVTAYAFEPGTGELTYLNKQPARGSITAHNTLSHDGSRLFVANYGIGSGGPDRSLVAFPINGDGTLGAPNSEVSHEGHGPNLERQERPHAHCVQEVREGLLVVADLGIDRLLTYAVDKDGVLTRRGETALPPGSGPRHLTVHPEAAQVFVLNELSSTVASLRWEGESGTLELLHVQSVVPPGDSTPNHASDIQISPDGRFLYCANRGLDTVAIVGVDPDGSLRVIDHEPCGGATPRNLCLTPSGRYLLCANQNADRIAILARDAQSGALSDTGEAIAIGTPMCVRAVEL